MKRLISVLLGMLGFFLFLHAVDANAVTKAVGSQPSAVSVRITTQSLLPNPPATKR